MLQVFIVRLDNLDYVCKQIKIHLDRKNNVGALKPDVEEIS